MLRYIRKLQKEDRLELVAACDISLEKFPPALEEKSLGTIRTNSDYDSFLNSERQLDAIIVRRKALFSKMGVEWATGTKPFRATCYREFKLFK